MRVSVRERALIDDRYVSVSDIDTGEQLLIRWIRSVILKSSPNQDRMMIIIFFKKRQNQMDLTTLWPLLRSSLLIFDSEIKK